MICKKLMSGKLMSGVAVALLATATFAAEPLKPRGAERVGYFTDKVCIDKAFVEEYFRLRADPAIDIVPVTQNQLDEGAAARFDRIVKSE